MALHTVDTQSIYSIAFIALNFKVFVCFIHLACFVYWKTLAFPESGGPEPPCFGIHHTSPPHPLIPRLCNHKILWSNFRLTAENSEEMLGHSWEACNPRKAPSMQASVILGLLPTLFSWGWAVAISPVSTDCYPQLTCIISMTNGCSLLSAENPQHRLLEILKHN